MPDKYKVLTEAQVEHFLEKGYVILRDCFSRELAQEWVAFAYKRLGYSPGIQPDGRRPASIFPQ